MSEDSGNSSAVLEVDHVDKAYGEKQVLNGVCIRVDAGEFLALLGPNGAGKTTLFSLLSGLLVPNAGEIRVAGRSIRRSPVRALAKMGIVFQDPALDLGRTVAANLHFHAQLHGMNKDTSRARISEEVEAFGLLDVLNRPVGSLSGGNRRKVELVRALLHQPSILLMDEATVGLDPRSRSVLVESVQGLCSDRQVGVLWATHLVDEAEKASRVVILEAGTVLADAASAELLRRTGASSLAEVFLSMTGGTGRESVAA